MTVSKSEFRAVSSALTTMADHALAAGRELGATACKVSTSASWDQRLVVEASSFSLANSTATQRLNFAVHKNSRKGSASTNGSSKDAVERTVANAIAIASYSVEDKFLTMPDTAIAPPATALTDTMDEGVFDLSLEELQRPLAEALEYLRRDRRIAVERIELSSEINISSIRNSLGVIQHEANTDISWDFMGMAKDADEVSGFEYVIGSSFGRAGFEERILASARDFRDRILKSLKPRKCPSYRGPVIFGPRAFEEIILDFVLYHMSGQQIMDGKSQWQSKLGQRVGSPLFSVRDNPHNTQLSGATAFDSDGLPTASQDLISAGILKLHFHDCYTANRLGVTTTRMGGGPFCLEVLPGGTRADEMATAATNVLYVDRFSGNTNPVEGSFSGVAKGGRLFVKGEDAGCVTETMIAGNVVDLLNNIVAVARETKVSDDSFICPDFIFDGVSVTGQ